MNKIVTPNMASILATDEFIRIVKNEMEKQNLTKEQIAKVTNVDRKPYIAGWMAIPHRSLTPSLRSSQLSDSKK